MGTELLTSVPRAIAETPAGSTLGALELVGMERAGVVSRCFPAQGVSHLYSSVTQEVGAMWNTSVGISLHRCLPACPLASLTAL